MSKLADIMGEDFEEEYQGKRQQAREEASKVSNEVMMEIAYEAINNEGFKGEEPRFRFSTDNMDHDVLLMESPDRDLQKFRHELGDDAMTMGMFHLDTLFSIAFQSNMIDLIDKIEEGEYYIVVGRYQEKTQTKGNGEEETYYNINPVRGILPLEVGKKYADKFEEQMGGTSVEEQSEEQQSESSDDEPDLGGLGDDEDDEVSDDDVVEIFHYVGDEAPSVLEKVAEGNEDMMDKLTNVVNQNVDGDVGKERVLDIYEDNVDSIDGRGEDEEDDEPDLSGLGDSDDDDEDSEDEEDDSPTDDGGDDDEEEASDDDSDEDSDPSDWF